MKTPENVPGNNVGLIKPKSWFVCFLRKLAVESGGSRQVVLEDCADMVEGILSDLEAWGDVASSPGAVEDMARENYDQSVRIQQLESRLAQAELERDELFMYLPHDCTTCRFELTCERSDECNCGEFWQWRGVRPDNTKEEK